MGGGHLLVAEHLGSVSEGDVGGDGQRGALVQGGGEEVEQDLALERAERYAAIHVEALRRAGVLRSGDGESAL